MAPCSRPRDAASEGGHDDMPAAERVASWCTVQSTVSEPPEQLSVLFGWQGTSDDTASIVWPRRSRTFSSMAAVMPLKRVA